MSIFRIGLNTFRECMRENVFFLLLVTALVVIGLFPTLSLFAFRQQIKLVADSALATTMMLGLFSAVICAGHTISREMKNGTTLLLMSKPVSRFSFTAAKILGINSALSVYVFVCASATVVAVLIARDQFQLDYTAMWLFYGVILVSMGYGGAKNYFSKRNFASNTVAALAVLMPLLAIVLYSIRAAGINFSAIDPEEFLPASLLLPALLLLFPCVWIMGAVSSALATRLDFISNLFICLALFFAGLVAHYFMRRWFALEGVSLTLQALIPNWQYFWLADALSKRTPVPASYIVLAYIYSLIHVTVWTSWAFLFFEESEVARTSR